MSRSNSRYNNRRNDREDYRGRSGSREGDRNGQDRPYSQEKVPNDDADYSKNNEPDIIQNADGDYDKNPIGDDQQQEVQIGVDANPTEINATENQYGDQQKDSYADNQEGEPMRGEGEPLHDMNNQGNPEQ